MVIKVDKNMVFPLSILAGFLVLIIVALSVCLPIIGAIFKAKEEMKAYDQELTFASGILSSKNVTKTTAQLISKKNIVLVMDELTNLGKKHGLDIIFLKHAGIAKQKSNFYQGILFEVESSSSFKDLGMFLGSVKDMPGWIMDLDSLKIVPDSADPLLVRAKFTLTLFVSKDNG